MKKITCVMLSAISLLMVNSFTSSSALFAQTWTSVESGGINISSAINTYDQQLQIFNNNLYAVWIESGIVRIKRYDGGTTWTVVDGGGKYWNSAACNSLATAVYNNALYMSWMEADTEVGGITRIHALKYDGAAFTFVQSHTAGSADDGKHYISLQQTQYAYSPALGVHNGKLYASWIEGTNATFDYQIHVSEFDGIYWKSVDGGNVESGLNKNYDGLSGKTMPYLTLTSYGNNLYAAWKEFSTANSQYQFRVKRFDGGNSWTFVDGNTENGLNYHSTNEPRTPIITTFNGSLYALWSEATLYDAFYSEANVDQIRVKKYDGSSWTFADGGTDYGWNKGQTYTAIAAAYNPVAMVYNNQMYVAWDEADTTNWVEQIRAVKFDGVTKTFIAGGENTGINQDVLKYAQKPVMVEYNGELYTTWQENTGTGTPYLFRIKKYPLPGIITSVTVPANSTYKASTNLDFTVNFNKIENVAGGTPYIPITLNKGGIVNANYLSGSGTKSLIFRYVVTSGNEDHDGITVGSGILLPGGCTLMDARSISASPNLNNIGSTASVLVDAVGPAVSISSTAGNSTNASPIPVTITFSESVTGFVVGDISVTNGTAGDFTTINGFTYTANITPSGQGVVNVNIAVSVAQDAAGNANTAAAQLSRTYDYIVPSVSVTSAAPDPLNFTPVHINITFSEAVTGFDVSDITVGNGTASNLQTSDNISWSADISPPPMGAFSVEIHAGVAQDLAGNGNTTSAYFQRTYDPVAPTFTLTSSSANPTKDNPIVVNIALSESSWNLLDISKIIVVNGTASNLKLLQTGYHENWTVDIYPAADGIVTVDIPAGSVHDFAGNDNIEATQFSRSCDITSPAVVISSISSELTNTSPIPVTITFSEPVTGFDFSDITVINGTAGNFSDSGSTYTADITPSGQGDVTVNIAAGVAQDTLGNDNKAATQLTRSYDNIAPAVLSVNSSTADSVYKTGDVITITTTFSEAITVTGNPTLGLNSGGTASYVSGSGATILTFNYIVTSGNSSADLDYLTTNSLSLSGGTMIDEAGNPALLTLPEVGGINSLGGQKNILIGIVPIVTTQAVSNILSTSATGNGNVTNLGYPNPIACGVCWNSTGTPTISDSKADNGSVSVTGAFTSSMTSLASGTTIYVRAYVTNIFGTIYGEEVSFTTNGIITYNLNGGINNAANTATYTCGEGLTLSDPTKFGYTFGGWYDNETFTGTNITAISPTTKGDITLYAKWTIKTYTISTSSGSNGNISPSGDISVQEGSAQSFTITPNSGYIISSVLIDGVGLGTINNYTFSNIVADHTISVSFEKSTGIENTIIENINIYPNPTVNGFYIKGINGSANIEVYDVNGRKRLNQQVVNEQFVSIDQLPAGFYVVKLKSASGVMTLNLIKQ